MLIGNAGRGRDAPGSHQRAGRRLHYNKNDNNNKDNNNYNDNNNGNDNNSNDNNDICMIDNNA